MSQPWTWQSFVHCVPYFLCLSRLHGVQYLVEFWTLSATRTDSKNYVHHGCPHGAKFGCWKACWKLDTVCCNEKVWLLFAVGFTCYGDGKIVLVCIQLALVQKMEYNRIQVGKCTVNKVVDGKDLTIARDKAITTQLGSKLMLLQLLCIIHKGIAKRFACLMEPRGGSQNVRVGSRI